MSVEYFFNKKISFDDIEKKTSLKIIEKDGNKWIADEFGNYAFIKEKKYHDEHGNPVDGPILELTVYCGNNSTKIRDELIKHFNVKFITDNEEEMFWREPELIKVMGEFFDSVTIGFGYTIEDGIVIVPERKDEDYQPYRNKETKEEESKTPIKNNINNEDTDDNLPLELPF